MESVCRPGVRSNILASDPSVASNVIALLKEVFFSTHQTPIKDCDDMWNFQSFVKQFHLWLFFFENSTFLHQFFQQAGENRVVTLPFHTMESWRITFSFQGWNCHKLAADETEIKVVIMSSISWDVWRLSGFLTEIVYFIFCHETNRDI